MQGGFPVGTSGSDWSYDDITKTLTLTSGTYDFSNTNPKTKTGKPTNQAVRCKIEIQSRAEITGGIFTGGSAGEVKNYGTISGGTFQNTCSVTNDGTIMGNGTFEGIVTNNSTISGGTFQNGCSVTNNNTISGGTFQNGCSVINNSNISDGTFEGKVKNHDGTISSGTFKGEVTNEANGKIEGGTFEKLVTNGGTIEKGTFNGKVINNEIINNGIFTYKVENNGNGTIYGGTFAGGVDNRKDGLIFGGVFNGVIEGTTGAGVYHITVDEASPGAKIEKVNDVPAVWDPYVVIEPGETKEVTVTASTEIYSLNHKPLSTNPYYSSQDSNDKNTVTFIMQNEGVKIGCGGLVMAYEGYPIGSNNGENNCEGKGWEYIKKDQSDPTNTGKLILKSGTFDFSSTYPQNTSKGAGAEPVACAVEIQSGVTITGGIFEKKVTNDGAISDGTFNGEVTNNSLISDGTFAAGLSKNDGNVTGGVFNGKTGLTNALQVTVTNGSVLKVNGEDPLKVDETTGAVTTDTAWDLYSYKDTTMTITADTEIFSLNHESISADKYGVDKKTVKFTMPDGPVVLNGAITCTDLVMKGGYPEASNGGTIPCKGDGWEYSNGTLVLENVAHFDFSSTEPVKCAIQSGAHITGGTFEGTVTNKTGGGAISDGIFKGSVENSSIIHGGTFRGQVDNSGKINGGIFPAGLSENTGSVTGGVFNGNTALTNAHQVTVTNGSVLKVNSEGPRNEDGTEDTAGAWDLYSYAGTTVTIIASTEIFSLNGKSIGDGNCNSSYPDTSKKTIVKFTMPDDKDVVLNGAITSTDLVMENGWPKDSNGGKNPCKGDGWQYIPNDPTYGNMLLLTGSNQTGGLFDFNTIGDGSAVECNVFVGKPTAITGGEFNGKVFNNSGILGGTFHGEVDNMGPGRIENGTFKNSVENNGMIENGTFEGTVENNTNGTISGGTFAGSVSNNGGTVNGGIFNGNTGLDEVTGLHSITWDAASSNAKIEKVNGVSADWKPYVVTSNATTKTNY